MCCSFYMNCGCIECLASVVCTAMLMQDVIVDGGETNECVTTSKLSQSIFNTIFKQWWWRLGFLFWLNKLNIVNCKLNLHKRNFVLMNFQNYSNMSFEIYICRIVVSVVAARCAVHSHSAHSIHFSGYNKMVWSVYRFRSGKYSIYFHSFSCWKYSGCARFIRWDCIFRRTFICNTYINARQHGCSFQEHRMTNIFIRHWNSTRNFLRSNLFGNSLHLRALVCVYVLF